MTIPKPVAISDASLAFPAKALDWMPAWEDIPEEFQTRASPWCDLPNTWFTFGLSSRFAFQPAMVDGELIDAPMAYRQLQATMGSFAPKHEHKIATVAYLASLWMESVVFGAPDTPDENLTTLGGADLSEWREYWANEGEA